MGKLLRTATGKLQRNNRNVPWTDNHIFGKMLRATDDDDECCCKDLKCQGDNTYLNFMEDSGAGPTDWYLRVIGTFRNPCSACANFIATKTGTLPVEVGLLYLPGPACTSLLRIFVNGTAAAGSPVTLDRSVAPFNVGSLVDRFLIVNVPVNAGDRVTVYFDGCGITSSQPVCGGSTSFCGSGCFGPWAANTYTVSPISCAHGLTGPFTLGTLSTGVMIDDSSDNCSWLEQTPNPNSNRVAVIRDAFNCAVINELSVRSGRNAYELNRFVYSTIGGSLQLAWRGYNDTCSPSGTYTRDSSGVGPGMLDTTTATMTVS